MTRINTNVSSLVAQNTLGRSNAALNEALTRLSTGLRINTGKDDPAGLIASENLRSDITSIKRAIGNTDRANQVIATADSALGQVSGLLNDIRGLVTEAANTGALSPDQIAANQLQLDSSLEALNRIAQTTTFQGRRLLDGSLDFITTAGTGFGTVANLKIDQANLGSTGQVAVAVDVSAAATQAQITNDGVADAIAGVQASDDLAFTHLAAGATGTVNISVAEQEAASTSASLASFADTVTGTLTIRAAAATHTGDAGNDLTVVFAEDNATDAHTSALVGDVLTITVGTDTAGATIDLDTILQEVRDENAGVNDFSDLFTYADGDFTGDYTVGTDDGGSAELAFAGGQDQEDSVITITTADGTASNITLTFVEGDASGGTDGVDISNVGTDYTVTLDNTAPVAVADIAAQLDAQIAVITGVAGSATTSTNNYNSGSDSVPADAALTGGRDAGGATITVTADAESATPNGVTVTVLEDGATANTVTADFNGNNIEVHINGTVTFTAINTAINGLAGYSSAVSGTSGTQNYVASTDTGPTATLANGVTPAGGLDDDIVLEIAGATGAEVVSFQALTTRALIVSAINAVSDATGVTAADNGGTLTFTSSDYGSGAFVSVSILNGDTDGTFGDALSATRVTGTDIVASVNGIQANGNGNALSINTATLDLSLTVDEGSSTDVNFTITGGGALFQLGPDVVSNQQARIGITSVNTARLGGTAGKLFQLGSGGISDLTTDTTTAAAIVEEAINQVTSLRGRLGAFQRTTLETNKNALNDTLVNLTEAESQIRDADFAAETANLTRAQILVQSGTTVLQITNQNPQNVLALLR